MNGYREHERRHLVKTNRDDDAPPMRADNTPRTCPYCGQTVAGPPQEYACPERPNETH